MHLLNRLGKQLSAERPFAGHTIGICLHIEPKTAVMCELLSAGGARVVLTGSPGTTQDDVVAALRDAGHEVFGRRTDGAAEHAANIRSVLAFQPDILLDNGASLVECLLKQPSRHAVRGGTEETTTGANLLREQMFGQVSFPVIVINDSPLKLIMENEHGVGPTVVASFLKVTNLQVPAKRFAVFGYGSVGRGIAKCLQAQHGVVTVVEPDPIRALEAVLQGLRIMSTEDALRANDVLITATGRPGAISATHLSLLRDGAILVNAGHYSWEIDLAALRAAAVPETIDAGIEVFRMHDGRQINLLTRGEMLNLAGGGGNPVETMDLGLALQVLSLRRVALAAGTLSPGPQPVPDDINREVAQAMVELLSNA